MLISVGVDRINTRSRDSNSLQGIELLIVPNTGTYHKVKGKIGPYASLIKIIT
jgi:hypothetical protein